MDYVCAACGTWNSLRKEDLVVAVRKELLRGRVRPSPDAGAPGALNSTPGVTGAAKGRLMLKIPAG